MNNLNYDCIELNEKKDKFTNLFLNKNIVDGRIFAVNNKHLAMSWLGNDEIVLAKSSKPCKIDFNQSRLKINNSFSKIQDIEFSPFNDNILALVYDNNSVFIWKIPEEISREILQKVFKFIKIILIK